MKVNIKTSLEGWLRSFKSLVARLGGYYEAYSGAAIVPCPDIKKAAEIIGGFYSPDYRAVVCPEGIIFIPRDTPESKVPGLTRYLRLKLKEKRG